jgi:major vault protein
LKAERPFVDDRQDEPIERCVGDEYLFKGPGTYLPRIEESIARKLEALLILPNNAVMMKAKRDFKD